LIALEPQPLFPDPFETAERECPLKLGTGGAPEIAALSGSRPKAPGSAGGYLPRVDGPVPFAGDLDGRNEG
jgi:hypothetical protein